MNVGQRQGDDRGHGPRLLVSVRDRCEAIEALSGGADWIDLKEPSRGPLGAVDVATAREVATSVGKQAPLSAAAGELTDWPAAASRELLTVGGVRLIKLGLAGCRDAPWQMQWRRAQAEIASAGTHLAAVAYADYRAAGAPSPWAVLELASDASCPWILLDTFDKENGALGDQVSAHDLAAWLAAARAAACGTAVAGSLDLAAVRRLPMGLVDVVAVRGAACEGNRTAQISRRRVAELAQLLSRPTAPDPVTVSRTRANEIAHGPQL